MSLLNTMHEKLDRLIQVPEHLARLVEATHFIAQGLQIMSAAQDRFDKALADLRTELTSFKSGKQAEIDDLKAQLDAAKAAPAAVPQDTNGADAALNEAADKIEAATSELKGEGPSSGESPAGSPMSSPAPNSASSAPASSEQSPTTPGSTVDLSGSSPPPAPADQASVDDSSTPSETRSVMNVPAPGGSPADALASGSGGTSTPTPIVGVH